MNWAPTVPPPHKCLRNKYRKKKVKACWRKVQLNISSCVLLFLSQISVNSVLLVRTSLGEVRWSDLASLPHLAFGLTVMRVHTRLIFCLLAEKFPAARDGRLQCASIFQACTCISFADILLARASHMKKPKFKGHETDSSFQKKRKQRQSHIAKGTHM